MTKVPRPPYRFDHVGSLLRPEALLKYREEWKKGDLSLEQLRVHEDECIRHAVRLQEEVGLESITDGEYRRESFHVDFITQIENVTSNWDFDEAIKVGKEDKAGQNKKTPRLHRFPRLKIYGAALQGGVFKSCYYYYYYSWLKTQRVNSYLSKGLKKLFFSSKRVYKENVREYCTRE